MVHLKFFPTLITNLVSFILGYLLPKEEVLPTQNTLVFPKFTLIGNLDTIVSRHVSEKFWSPPPHPGFPISYDQRTVRLLSRYLKKQVRRHPPPS